MKALPTDDYRTLLKKLTSKQYQFFVNLTSIESPSQSDIVKSYYAAHYKETKTSPYEAIKLYYSDKFQRLLTLYREKHVEKKENRVLSVLERTDQDLLFIIDNAKRTMDLGLLRSATMDRAKLHGLLVDRHQVIDPASQSDLDNSVKLEAAKLAERMLLNAPESTENADLNDNEGEIIDSEFEPFNDDTDSLSDDTPDDSEGFLADKTGFQ